MIISPVPSVAVPTIDSNGSQSPSRVESVRNMRMRTNATPMANQPGAQQMSISSLNDTEVVTEATEPLSPQLALLAKQRRALQRERQLINQEKAKLSQSSGSSVIDAARLKSEPLRVLLENGITYDQLTEAIMANQENSEFNSLKAEMEALKQGIDQKFTEKDAAAERQVLAEMRREADQLVASNDDFEMIRVTNNTKNVMKLIERTYRETGEVLAVPEALQLFENELFKDAQKLATLKKMQIQMSQQSQQRQQQRQTGMRTLTNRDTASVPLSAKARAIAAFYGTLKR